MLRKLPILLMLLTSSFLSWGQGRSILGTVISATDAEPVIGANVQLKGKSAGTVTDIDGTFRLSVTETDILVISYIGFETLEIPVEGRSELHIKLLEDTRLLDEIVAVGYTTQRKVDLTGAVSTVNVSDVENISSGNVMQALKGRIAGMQVTTSGAPDGGSTIRIRGIGTLGNNDPLYIIDGVPSKRSMNELNSNDIESIQVLKDASSASIYGSRAANGVIIITTKRGKAGETKVDFRTFTYCTELCQNRSIYSIRMKEDMCNGGRHLTTVLILILGCIALNGITKTGQIYWTRLFYRNNLDNDKTMRPADTD